MRRTILYSNPSRKFALLITSFVIYTIAFLLLAPRIGGGSFAAISVVPVLISASFYGIRTGLLIGLAVLPLNTLLLNVIGYNGWQAIATVGGVPGSLAVIAIGGIAGYLNATNRDRDRLIGELSTVTYQLEGLIAAIPEEIYRLDADGYILAYHPGQETNLELPTRDVLDKH